jgi:integrating conjugative element protein (TIGR03765 family)
MAWIKGVALTLSLALAIAGTAQAKLTVVADDGGQSATPYSVAIKDADVSEQNGYHAQAEASAHRPVTEADMLPVHSKRLTPGRVASRAIHLPPATTPFFLIGDGDLSQRWLQQRGPRLRQLHAVGLVVKVNTAAQLRHLRALGDGLILRPVTGDDIAKRLGLAHYPVLITPRGLQQ